MSLYLQNLSDDELKRRHAEALAHGHEDMESELASELNHRDWWWEQDGLMAAGWYKRGRPVPRIDAYYARARRHPPPIAWLLLIIAATIVGSCARMMLSE